MKSGLSKFALVLMNLILCLMTVMPAAFAEAGALTVQINAQVTLEGTQPDTPESMVIRLKAEDADNPMPDGQVGGIYDLTITGAGAEAFPPMSFDALGVYKYTIEQLPGSYAGCEYDDRTYQLTVSVVNSEDGGYGIEVAIRETGKTEKIDTVLFHNVYATVMPTPAPTTQTGEITQTGVNDMWMYYAIGAGALIIVSIMIALRMRREEDGEHEEN